MASERFACLNVELSDFYHDQGGQTNFMVRRDHVFLNEESAGGVTRSIVQRDTLRRYVVGLSRYRFVKLNGPARRPDEENPLLAQIYHVVTQGLLVLRVRKTIQQALHPATAVDKSRDFFLRVMYVFLRQSLQNLLLPLDFLTSTVHQIVETDLYSHIDRVLRATGLLPARLTERFSRDNFGRLFFCWLEDNAATPNGPDWVPPLKWESNLPPRIKALLAP